MKLGLVIYRTLSLTMTLNIVIGHLHYRQKAQLPQRHRATRYIIVNCALFHEMWELGTFQAAKVAFKVIQGHWQWYHLIANIQFPITLLVF